MDRNSIIGIALITAIIIGWGVLNQPTEAEKRIMQERRDSLAQVRLAQEKALKAKQTNADFNKEAKKLSENKEENDSLRRVKLQNRLGSFASAGEGKEEFVTLENQYLKVKLSTKGGRPYSVELKNYKTYDSSKVILFDGKTSHIGINFPTVNNRMINTSNLFFVSTSGNKNLDASKQSQTIGMRLKAANNKYIEFSYTLQPDSYILDYNINFVNIEDIIPANTTYLDFRWWLDASKKEKGKEWENNNTTIYYKHFKDEVDYLSERSEAESKDITTSLKWIAYKQQFFSSILIAKDHFTNAKIKYQTLTSDTMLKHFETEMTLGYRSGITKNIPLQFYFGPNHYNTLAENDLNMEKLVPLGWGIFGWVNRLVVIPLFNLLGSFIGSFGLIILLMTLIIKLVLFPLTYRSYLSTAKMRVLKPEIDAITKKIPKDKAMERQQATMALYKKTGVSPLGGCLPMLLQMPILIAMYNFFPASIELRQESFLWATDLSSFDSIFDLPFAIPAYGDHISLFTLLMAASMMISTRLNGSQQMGDNNQMAGMKFMMTYGMPVMLLIWFNNYAAALSYYYFLSNIITTIQTLVIRRFVDDKAILSKLNEKKKKPVKKSGFQQRLEQMARERNQQKKK